MATYLEDFQAMVKAAHRRPDRYCHWTRDEELTWATPITGGPKRGLKGPCDCPKPPRDKACDEHGQLNCASTTDVLAIRPPSQGHYAPKLDALQASVADLGEAIDKFTEAYHKAISDDNNTPGEALHNSRLDRLEAGHWGVNPKAYKAVDAIAKLHLDVRPNPGSAAAGCDCKCFRNKLFRLKTEKAALKDLFAEAGKASEAVAKGQADLTATFGNTVLPVLQGSMKVVGGLFSGELDQTVEGAKDLLKYLDSSSGRGGQIYALLLTAKALADMKRLAMLGVIYHDQQLAAPTCIPVDDDDEDGEDNGNGDRENGNGDDGEDEENGNGGRDRNEDGDQPPAAEQPERR